MDATTIACRRADFRNLLARSEITVAPGIADVLTARLVVACGFSAVYLSGSLQHAVRGYADVNALTMSEMVLAANAIANEIPVPCLADAEAGFGIGINVRRSIREYERTGVAAIHLEDSMVPKRPARLGFSSPTVTTPEFLDKIKAALDARTDAAMVIVARSEMLGDSSAKADRLQAALELGADAFWAGGFGVHELPGICQRLGKPALAVLPKKLTASEFGALGVRLCVIPGALAMGALIAQRALLQSLRETGSWSRWLEEQPGFEDASEFYDGQGIGDI
jgi:2-methylisocitrate lyase-like PEP mutase family enzyme